MLKFVDFRCRDCDHVYEALVNDSDANPSCPECSSSDVIRRISAPKLAYGRISTDGKSSSDAMTSSIDRWMKGRAQKMKTEQRNLERHGTYN